MQIFQVSGSVWSDGVQKGAGISVRSRPGHQIKISGFQVLLHTVIMLHKHLAGEYASTRRRSLIPPRAVGVIYDLALDNPLPLIIPPGTMAVMTAVALPIVADFALVLDLSNAVLSPCSDTVRYLDQLEDVLLESTSSQRSAPKACGS